MGRESKETLTALTKYQSSHLSPKPSPTYFQPRESLFEHPYWQKTLHSMSWLGLGGLVRISRIPSPLMAFLVSFHTIKLGWMSLFFLLLQIIGSLLGIFFTSMELNYAPLSWVRIFPFCCKLHWMSLLLRQIGGVSSANSTLGWFLSTFLVRAFSWVKGHIHTFFMPFTYVPLQGISWFKIHCVDLWMCMVACELKRGNPVGLILAETQCFRCLS